MAKRTAAPTVNHVASSDALDSLRNYQSLAKAKDTLAPKTPAELADRLARHLEHFRSFERRMVEDSIARREAQPEANHNPDYPFVTEGYVRRLNPRLHLAKLSIAQNALLDAIRVLDAKGVYGRPPCDPRSEDGRQLEIELSNLIEFLRSELDSDFARVGHVTIDRRSGESYAARQARALAKINSEVPCDPPVAVDGQPVTALDRLWCTLRSGRDSLKRRHFVVGVETIDGPRFERRETYAEGWVTALRKNLDELRPPLPLDYPVIPLKGDGEEWTNAEAQNAFEAVREWLARNGIWEPRGNTWEADRVADVLSVRIGTSRTGSPSQPNEAECKPHWDGRQLSFAGNIVAKYQRHSAKNQAAILEAFQLEGWPRRILDPLPGGTDSPEKRLRDTLATLNRKQSAIKFHADGTGQGIVWELVPPVH